MQEYERFSFPLFFFIFLQYRVKKSKDRTREVGPPFWCSPSRPALRGWLIRLRLNAKRKDAHGIPWASCCRYLRLRSIARKVFTASCTARADAASTRHSGRGGRCFCEWMLRRCSQRANMALMKLSASSSSSIAWSFKVRFFISKLLRGWSSRV